MGDFEDAFHSKAYYIEEAKLAQNVKGMEHLAKRAPPGLITIDIAERP